jgi:glycerol kinase
MPEKYIISFDAGTTGCRSILFDKIGRVVASAYKEFPQIYPKPGWVEHDPMDILNTQMDTAKDALARAKAEPFQVAAIGITNQRETVVIWEKASGKPILNAIVWQDRRGVSICEELKSRGLDRYVRDTTGLLIDSYFSATKIRWVLDNVSGAREKAEAGELLCGTVDTWLIWNLTSGRVHVTDYSNASRTMLFNIKEVCWDDVLLKEMGIPKQMLPQAMPTSCIYGVTDKSAFWGASVPLGSSVGDQQSALFGQACFSAGMVKVTYGTGGSLMMNTGSSPKFSDTGMLTSIAWGIDGKVEYVLEGLLYVVGAAVQWLRDELRIINSSEETEDYASLAEGTDGVYFVPAFVGLSAPYWDPYARGALLGLTRGSGRKQIVRSVLESIAYQMKDVIDCMRQDSGIEDIEIKVDGGVCRNNFLMQFQADILNCDIYRPKVVDATARGAAFLAGLATNFWKDRKDFSGTVDMDRVFKPSMSQDKRDALYDGWKNAVERVR